MGSKIKVMTILGTRPEIIRLSRVIAVLQQVADHVLVHTGQNYDYELNEIYFKELGVPKPDHYLSAAGKNAAETIGRTIAKVDVVLEKEKPEAVLVLGDTNSCLAVIPAKRNRRQPRDDDRHLYAARHLIENFFAKLKQYRALATRYDKRAAHFLGAIYLAAAVITLN